MRCKLIILMTLISVKLLCQTDLNANLIYELNKVYLYEECLRNSELFSKVQCQSNSVCNFQLEKLKVNGFINELEFYRYRLYYEIPVECYDSSGPYKELKEVVNLPYWQVFAYNLNTKKIYRISGFKYNDFQELIIDGNLKYDLKYLRSKRKFKKKIKIENIDMDFLYELSLGDLKKRNIFNGIKLLNNQGIYNLYSYPSKE